MTPEQRQQIETQIKNDFTEVQKKLNDLKTEVQIETDAAKKQKKIEEIQRLEKELAEMKDLIDRITYLHEKELLALKSKLDEYKAYKQEILAIRKVTPTTYEILKESKTYDRLFNIISSNPNEFKKLPGDTAEKKLEYIFTKIRSSIVLFMKNKLGESSRTEYVINNTIAPAFEWSLLELLTIQGNETNVHMIELIDNISFKKLGDLVNGVGDFSKKMSGSYNKFNQWMNAIDYLSVHNGVLSNPKKSAVLTNPLKFEAYLNNSKFGKDGFSPYAPIEGNIFEVSDDENFEFGLSSTEEILKKIGDIKVENNPRTTSLIAKMIDKPEKFLKKTDGLQKTANGLLDGLNSVNIAFKTFGIDKILGTDILGEFTKAPEKRSFWYRIVDFVCKLIGITGGLEGIVKRWRLDRMNLTDEKNHNISEIFKWYQKAVGENVDLNITDDDSCKAALADFAVTDFDDSPTTKGDYLRDSIIYNMNLSLISPAVVSQAIEQNVLSKSREEYLKEEVVTVKGKQQQKITIIPTGFTSNDIKNLAQNHLKNMKAHLEAYDDNELQDFYTSIKSTEDLALCITAALYADRDDVIEGVKANVFLPENYGSVRIDGTVENAPTNSGRENLESAESSDKQIVTEQWVYDKAVEYGITDNRQIAYVLSTIKGESGFKNQKEIGGENREYGKVDSTTGKAYYGRGFIQITHKGNYEKYTQIIRESGRDFKDNDGNILKGSDIDLVNNPDVILQSNDLAIFIAMDWMKNGGPSRLSQKRLDYFINDSKQDYYNARSIINGMSSKPQEYADNAQSYLARMNGSSDSSLA